MESKVNNINDISPYNVQNPKIGGQLSKSEDPTEIINPIK